MKGGRKKGWEEKEGSPHFPFTAAGGFKRGSDVKTGLKPESV